jgi:radical SAM superfamily enzyme YgiQ (UPF0313 family)
MYISSVLKHLGHDVKVLNFNVFEYNIFEELKGIEVALFTGFEEFSIFNKFWSKICKENGVHTVLGGAEATFNPNEMLKFFDAVVVGEGENVVEESLTRSGILYGTKPVIEYLPFPDYEGFGIAKYNQLHHRNYMGVLTSRGCPHHCKFCAHTCNFQYRDLKDALEEINLYMSDYKVDYIVFNDNTLNLNKDRFLNICGAMKDFGLKWSAAIRADKFDKEMAKAAKGSGCDGFVVGVESFNDNKLKIMGKKITVAQIKSTLNLLHKFNIKYLANVLFGLPGETFEDIMRELQTIPQQYNIFPVLVQPFVGTEYQTRTITDEQSQILSNAFREYAGIKGGIMWEGVK